MNSDHEKESLLSEDDQVSQTSTLSMVCVKCHESRNRKLKFWILPTLVHTTVLLIIALLFSHTVFRSEYREPKIELSHDSSMPSLYSPLRDLIQYEIVKWKADAWENSIFTSEPSHESDLAWNKYTQFRGAVLSDTEAAQLNMTTLPVARGHATLLGVGHNLHCVRYIRQVLYKDYYYWDKTAEDMASIMEHTHHCLETIRLSVMCMPDLTPMQLYWKRHEGSEWEVGARSESVRECVKWEPLDKWMHARHYALNDLVPS